MGDPFNYYAILDGVQKGPFTESLLAAMIQSGEIQPHTLVWRPGDSGWQTAETVRGLFAPPVLPDDIVSDTIKPPPTPAELPAGHSSNDAPPSTLTGRQPDPLLVASPMSTPSNRSWIGRSFFGKHWRGEYSLPVSYWIIGLIATVLVLFLTALIDEVFSSLSQEFYSPGTALAALTVWWSICLSIYFWQVAGVWRSSNFHKSRGGKEGWATLAKIMVVVGLLNTATQLGAYAVPQFETLLAAFGGDKDYQPRDIKILRNGTELAYSGGITFGAAADLKKILDAAPGVKILHLNSYGGRVTEAKAMGVIVKQHDLATYTSEACVSACTLVFMHGRERWLKPSAKLGFHAYDFDKFMPSDDASAATAEAKKELRELGVSSAFTDRIFSTSSGDMWYPSQQELVEAKVVTGIAAPEAFAFSALQLNFSPDSIDRQVSKVPLFAAMKVIEPAAYADFINTYAAGARNGSSEQEIMSAARLKISAMVPKFLRASPQDLLLNFTRLMVEELKVLAMAKDGSCFAFLYPAKANRIVDVRKYFSPELQQRDLAMLESLVRASATPTKYIVKKSEAERLIGEIVPRIESKHGAAALAAVANPEDTRADPEDVCRGSYGFYEEILNLPAAQSETVLRFLFDEL